MTDYVYLSTAAVANILLGVAMLLTFAIGVVCRPQRNYIEVLFGCLALIWAGAILVIVLIKLQKFARPPVLISENIPSTHRGV